MSRVPLAERMRPQKLDEVVGQDSIIGKGKILTEIVKKAEPVNLIFWGPPGTGKTTLARILAKEFQADFVELSAVTAKKADIETVVERAKTNWNLKSAPSYLWTKFTVSIKPSKTLSYRTLSLA